VRILKGLKGFSSLRSWISWIVMPGILSKIAREEVACFLPGRPRSYENRPSPLPSPREYRGEGVEG
jgi:hypothetical protein